ncbi:MAG: hypothetical protein ACRD2T_16070 [Thermoanaerobaculia bacterium]
MRSAPRRNLSLLASVLACSGVLFAPEARAGAGAKAAAEHPMPTRLGAAREAPPEDRT